MPIASPPSPASDSQTAPDLYRPLAPDADPTTDGLLSGSRICVQPRIAVGGWRMEAGSAALAGYVASEDAFVIERLRAGGAQLTGSVRIAEFGFGLEGDTTGPAVCRDNQAAVLADALGESRMIAAEHGLWAFQPSHGAVSRRGLAGLIPSMETLAVVARDAGTLERVLQAVVAPDALDPSMRQQNLPGFGSPAPDASSSTVGVVMEAVDRLDPKTRASFHQRLVEAAGRGLTFREATLPGWAMFRPVHHVIGSVEASSSAGRYDGVRYGHRVPGAANWNDMYLHSRAESFGALLKSYLFQGAGFQFLDYDAYENACRIRRRLVADVEALFGAVDLLALPVSPGAADAGATPSVSGIYDRFESTLPANVLGLPVLCHNGIQWIAPRYRDANLLALMTRLAGGVP